VLDLEKWASGVYISLGVPMITMDEPQSLLLLRTPSAGRHSTEVGTTTSTMGSPPLREEGLRRASTLNSSKKKQITCKIQLVIVEERKAVS
jgi:hypothetical protein